MKGKIAQLSRGKRKRGSFEIGYFDVIGGALLVSVCSAPETSAPAPAATAALSTIGGGLVGKSTPSPSLASAPAPTNVPPILALKPVAASASVANPAAAAKAAAAAAVDAELESESTYEVTHSYILLFALTYGRSNEQYIK